MVLLPKMVEATARLSANCPHLLGKLIAKVLANRLAPKLGKLVHVS
jgi:hypothetical protein